MRKEKIMDEQSILSKATKLLTTYGVEYSEMRIEYTDLLEIHISDSTSPKVDINHDHGGCIRIKHKGSWSFVSFTDFSQIDRYFDIAYLQAIHTEQTSDSLIDDARVSVVKDNADHRQFIDPRQINLNDKIHLLSCYYQLILKQGGYISAANVNYFEKITRILFLNSEGSHIDQTKYDVSASFVMHVKNGETRDTLCMDVGSMQGFDTVLGLDDQLIDFCSLAQNVITAGKVEAGVYPVIFDPALASLFIHESIGHLCEADEFGNNPDFLSEIPLGTRLASEKLNVYDTGEFFFTRGGLEYDDEGVLCQRSDLISKGSLVGLLHNRHSAAVHNSMPSGNARAVNYRFPPIVRMRCICIEPGSDVFNDMIQEIDYGIYALGAGTGRVYRGSFQFSSRYAFIIRNGKVCEQAKGITFSGNIFDFLSKIDKIGAIPHSYDGPGGCSKGDQFALPTGGYCPHIRVQNVRIEENDE